MDHPAPETDPGETPAPERPSDFFVPVQQPVPRIAIRWIPHSNAGAHTLILPVMHIGVIQHDEDGQLVVLECQSFLITFDFAERHELASRWEEHLAQERDSKIGESESGSPATPSFQSAQDFVVHLQREVVSVVHALGDEALGILVKRVNPMGSLEEYPPKPVDPSLSPEDDEEQVENEDLARDLAESTAGAFDGQG